jgi:methionyl aminopeptidase
MPDRNPRSSISGSQIDPLVNSQIADPRAPAVTLNGMSIDSDDDRQGMRRAGRAVAAALRAMEAALQAGLTTRDLDAAGAQVLREHGARSAPQIVYRFAGINLISVNDEIVHGIPGARRLAAGDIVKLDVTAELDGYIADAAVTVVIEPAPSRAHRLRASAVGAFDAACEAARAGRAVSDIGRAVESRVRADGFTVLRALSGHGVGRTIHEPPTVHNYFDPRQRDVLTDGLVITIEPIIAERRCHVVEDADGWTLRTSNGCMAAHYEHTVIITSGGPEIVTA